MPLITIRSHGWSPIPMCFISGRNSSCHHPFHGDLLLDPTSRDGECPYPAATVITPEYLGRSFLQRRV